MVTGEDSSFSYLVEVDYGIGLLGAYFLLECKNPNWALPHPANRAQMIGDPGRGFSLYRLNSCKEERMARS